MARQDHKPKLNPLFEESKRLATFQGRWPSWAKVTPESLAKAGFYYPDTESADSDMVECAFCRWRINEWEEGDKPKEEHRKNHVTCTFLKDPTAAGNVPILVSWKSTNPKWNAERQTMSKERDCLDYDIYASKLSDLITDKSTATPLTVGIFANWGVGKTSVLELIEQNITEHNEQKKASSDKKTVWKSPLCFCMCCGKTKICCTNKLGCTVLLQLFILLLLLVAAISALGAMSYVHHKSGTNSTKLENNSWKSKPHWYMEILVILVPFIFLMIVVLCFVSCVYRSGTEAVTHCFKNCISNFFYPAEKYKPKKDVEIISVKFNAWEYAGCDLLWAGIAHRLCDTLVQHFGKFRCIWYRMIKNQYAEATGRLPSNSTEENNGKARTQGSGTVIQMDTFSSSEGTVPLMPIGQKTNHDIESNVRTVNLYPFQIFCIPKHVCFFGIVCLFILLFVVLISYALMGTLQKLKVVISSVIAVGTLLAIAKFLLGAFRICTDPIHNLMKLHNTTKLQEGLGAMHQIKSEVTFLTGMIKYMEWMDNKEYRVLIIVDDLDRCEKSKVLKVFEAISIILSEADTSFVSLIAVDSRIVMHALESEMKEAMNIDPSLCTVNGHEYLKKIIHLPFWLPTANNMNIDKLVDKISFAGGNEHSTINANSSDMDPQITATSADNTATPDQDVRPSGTQEKNSNPFQNAVKSLKFFAKSNDILSKNPRHVKRIGNVLNLALRLWGPSETEMEEMEKLTRLLVIAEQWPYRTGLLAQIAQDKDRGEPYTRINDSGMISAEDRLKTLFRANEMLLALPERWKSLITFDLGDKDFETALDDLTVKDFNEFMPYLINLDHSLVEAFCIAIVKKRVEDVKKRIDEQQRQQHPTNADS